MRKSLWVALFVAIVLYLGRVPPGSERQESASSASAVEASPAIQERPAVPVRMRVLTSRGVEATLTIDESTEVLVVATWCVYSQRLNSVLRDPRSNPYLMGKQLVYLLAYDELDQEVARWVREGSFSQAQADAYLERLPRGPRLVDREFLRTAATRRVYFYDAAHPIRHGGYPSAFSGPPNEFLMNYGVWMSRRLGMPKELKETFWAAYPVEGEGG